MAAPTVLELIHARLKDKSSQPGHRKDPYTLAFAVEDGAMKWLNAAGFLSRLEEHGILPDLLVGSSGGGMAAAYYAAGAIRPGSMVLRYLNGLGFDRDGHSRKFIDPYRLLRGEPIMDVGGTVNIVFSQRVPLPWTSLARTPVPTYLTAVTRQGELLLQPLHGQHVAAQKSALQDTARIPVIAHSARDKSVLWDGGLAASIPLAEAFDLGATHVLVIRCKGSTDTLAHLTALGLPEKAIIVPPLLLQSPSLLMAFRRRPVSIRAALARLATPSPTLAQLALPTVNLNSTEADEGRLFRQLVTAWHHAGKALALPERKLPAEWAPEAARYL